jgi:hypothetical protein
MKRAGRGKLTGLWLGITAIGLSMALAIPSADAAGRKDRGFMDSFDRMAIHGYVDNFSILRSDNFKDDYHIASSRYRASVQLAGPLYIMQDYFQRFEYFIELRPEYESIYDISHRFGNGRNGKVSGRSGKPSQNNVDLLKAFGLAPRNYGGFWPKEPCTNCAANNIEFIHTLTPGAKYGVPGRDVDSRSRGYYGLDASQNDLRFGMLRETNMDLYYPVREAYLDLFWRGFGGRNWLRIGKQQHVWGKADFFRLQDIVNPVNFGDHFFIDLFDDTRVPLWSALFEHRFGNIGFLRDVAGSVIYVFDRHTPTGLGHPAQPWATGFGRTIDGFVFGNDLFSSAVFPGMADHYSGATADRPYLPFKNMALYKNRAPHWNLKNGGVGMRWEATVGNLRIQVTDYFAFPDLPVTGWDRLNILNTPGCTTDGNGNSILPADRNEAPITTEQLAGADPKSFHKDGGTVVTSAFGPVVAGVKPKHIQIREAGVFKKGGAGYGTKAKNRHAKYANLCGLGGSLSARWRKTNTLGLSLDWFEPYTGFVVRWESSWTTNALLNDTAKIDLMGDGNAFKWVLGIDRPTLIRWLNPTRSFFLSAQAYGTHYPDSRAGRRGIVSENNNFIFTVFAQNHFMRDQLVYLVFGAFGTAAQDGTTGGNIEYLITNNWSVTLGFTAFIGARHKHDLGAFGVFTGDPSNPYTEAGFGLFHMQAGGSERNQMNEFWGRLRYRF